MNSFRKRLKSMLLVDFKRLFHSPSYYIMLGISLIIPILILVMTSMMDGNVSVDPQTGKETVFEGFKNVWQIIGSVNGSNDSQAMDITSMCNINLMFFIISAFVVIFIGEEFRSGYVKNLFTVRSKKNDYIISKEITLFIVGANMVIMFFIGSMIGGAIAGLSFSLDGINPYNIVMSLLSKIFLVSIFISLYTLASIIGGAKIWMSILISLGIGMLLFTMIPMITPLNSTIINLIMCIVGSGLFSVGISVGSYYILKNKNIV